MLSKEDNELVTNTNPGTPMGELFRRFWLPVALSDELPGPDCVPCASSVLGEDLIAFRDTRRQASASSTPTAPTAARRCSSAATRRTACAASTTAGSSTSTATASTCRTRPRATPSRTRSTSSAYPCVDERRPDLGLHGPGGQAAALPRVRVDQAAARPPLRDQVPSRVQLPAGHGGRLRPEPRPLPAQHPRRQSPATRGSNVRSGASSATFAGDASTSEPFPRAVGNRRVDRRRPASADQLDDDDRRHAHAAPTQPGRTARSQASVGAPGGCRSSAPPASRGPAPLAATCASRSTTSA